MANTVSSSSTFSEQDEINEKMKQIEKNLEEMEKEALLLSQTSQTKLVSNFKSDSLIMRHLLFLFKGHNTKKNRNIISRQLSFILCQKNGLLSFIRATCDFDKTSEKETTFDKKFRAISTIITKMPEFHISLEEYYQCLGLQLITLLSSHHLTFITNDSNKWKLLAYIINGFYEENAHLTQKYIISPLTSPITNKNENLNINDSLLAIYRLVVTHFSKNHFINIFPNLFYIYVHLNQKVSHLKTLVNDIILDLLNSIDHSYYLLDYALSKCFSFYDLYTLSSKQNLSNQESIIIELRDKSETNLISEFEKTDQIVQLTVKLMDQVSDSLKIDLFLLFLEKLSFLSSKHILLFLSLVGALQEKIFNIILNYPSKAIRFLNTNLNRLSLPVRTKTIQQKIDNEDVNDQELDNNFLETDLLQQESISIVFQILTLLLEEQDKLSEEDIIGLKECDLTLEKFLKSEQMDEVTRLKIKTLSKKLKNLTTDEKKKLSCDESEFYKIILELNSEFMPLRAHSLITLKRLIDRKDPLTIKNQDQILTLLKASLSDPESYIYLHSINALSSLTLANTDHVLTVLINAFQDKTRTIEERVSVGQTLTQLNKYIGDMAHYYSKQLVDCFLKTIKDENVSIRVSSISNLGQLCMSLRYALSYYIVEIIHAIHCLLETDSEMNVKKACVMFIYMLMSGLDKNTFQVIQNEVKTIYKLIKNLDSTCLGDDVLRIHAHLALKEIDERVKEVLRPTSLKIIQIK